MRLLESLQIRRSSVKLATLALLSVLGGISSMPVGYAGRVLSLIPGGSTVTGQVLSGLHVFWLVLAVVLLKRMGSATATGTLKGLVETLLFSHLGIFVLLISFVEGFVLDIALLLLRKTNGLSLCLASGFSAASNVVVLRVFLIPELPFLVYVVMFMTSFLSGLLLGGFLAVKVTKNLRGIYPEGTLVLLALS